MNLRLSKATGYAVCALNYLQQRESVKPVMVREIADHLKLPHDSVLKVLRLLAKARVVTAHRGSKGGFSLRKSAIDITLLDVIEIIDGPLDADHHPTLKGTEGKPIADDLLKEATEQLKTLLSRGSIQDI